MDNIIEAKRFRVRRGIGMGYVIIDVFIDEFNEDQQIILRFGSESQANDVATQLNKLEEEIRRLNNIISHAYEQANAPHLAETPEG